MLQRLFTIEQILVILQITSQLGRVDTVSKQVTKTAVEEQEGREVPLEPAGVLT